MVEPLPTPDPAGFWAWFSEHQHSLLEIIRGRGQGKVTDQFDAALARHGLQVAYEITEGELGGELTFTPEGDPEVAAFLDRLVKAAPTLPAWRIHSRIQRKSLAQAKAFVKALHGVDLTGLHLQVATQDGLYHLRFLHPDLARLPENQRFDVAGTFLDHALGEAIAMGFVASVGFTERGEGLEVALVINEIIRRAEQEARA